MALSLAGWLYLVADRRGEIRAIAAETAASSRRSVEAGVRSHVSALRNLAGFWASVGRRPVEEWRASAELLLESHPSLEHVAWLPGDGSRRRIAVGRSRSGEPTQPGSYEDGPPPASARLIGPEPGPSGAPTMRVLLPVAAAGRPGRGALEARLDLERLLGEALEESAPGYAVRIHWAGELVYARGEPSRDPWQRWWREEGTIELPLGTAWTARHAPTPALAAAWLDPVPHYLLAVGIVLAVALGVLSHQLRLSFLRARFLAAGNEALELSAGELRRLNEALESRVQERTRELEAFTHSISHDLRSPLGAILNYAAILELDYPDRPLDAEGRRILGRIGSSAQRGTELLEGLLRLSRAGDADLEMAELDMDALVRECFARTRQAHGGAEAELAVEPLPPARGDRTLVGEVLTNLLDNAFKYSREREKRRIAVRGRVEGGECVYEVEDNGEGFDMRYAGKLFRLFQRLHGSREVEGTGVGLALVARIVARHGGRVEAEGCPGEGARFRFSLPAARATEDA